MWSAVEFLWKNLIDAAGFSDWVYDKDRGAILVDGPFVVAIASAAVRVYSLAPWNPDYEIGKNLVTRTAARREGHYDYV